MNIVVVDDSRTILSMVSYILSNKGHQVVCLSSAEQAIEYLTTNTTELLITDINMPGMGGHNLITKLKTQEAYKNLPIIVNSTKRNSNELNGLVNVWISKPLNADKLLKAIEQAYADQ